MEIRSIQETDVEAFRSCLDVVARERKYLAMVEAPPPDKVADFVRNNISKGYPQFVAVDDEQIVGWCDIHAPDLEGFRHLGTLGVGVHPAYRKQGLGERLLHAAIEEAKTIGLERIELTVYATNAIAIKIYEKAGFTVDGVRRRARKLDGAYDDIILMSLML
jgi:RimJ/RimL family protein N-acetyltransferase